MAGETPTARWRRELSNLWTYADYPELGQFTVRYSAALPKPASHGYTPTPTPTPTRAKDPRSSVSMSPHG
jgi:hypothetical protein